MLNQDDAREIARKLEAKIETRHRKHDLAIFRHQGKRITQFGIRRASRDAGHDYIPSQLFISAKQCREFRDCSLTLEAYLKILEDKGKIEKTKKP